MVFIDFERERTCYRCCYKSIRKKTRQGSRGGDAGRIYFWIHEDDLASLCFDRVVCEMQCT
ncbi:MULTISPECIES: DUF1963 domain-containing protein [Paenibacillus]|uniref:DUF1963 domain-containing protein n=1 Tax=Paenibacillus TaxID=44249 RepID=UPI0030F5E785